MTVIDEFTRKFIHSHRKDDVRSLALQSQKYKGVNMPIALTQIAGWKKAVEKIPAWSKVEDILYPVHLSLEQCSSESTALFKADIIRKMRAKNGDEYLQKGPFTTPDLRQEKDSSTNELSQKGSFADLTGGFGIDCAFLAPLFHRATYIERQQELCEIASHNYSLLGLDKVEIIHEDGCNHLKRMSPVDWIFIDPARRDKQGGKVFAIADCEPNVVELEPSLLEKAEQVMIKLSPMLDLSQAMNELKGVEAAYVVSVDNECKELLIILGRNPVSPEQVPVHCVNLSTKKNRDFQLQYLDYPAETSATENDCIPYPSDFSFTREQESNSICNYTAQPEGYLYEPNASILKAGAFKSIAMIYQLKKLHPNSHLYVSDNLIDGLPGRRFHINGVSSPNKKELFELLGGIKKANLSIRNFPGTTAELGKKLNVKDGGDIYLFATTLADEQKVIIHCEKC